MDIQESDAYLHRPFNEDPWHNEVSWIAFKVPERLINGFVYFHHRPNMKHSVGGVAVWDPSGEACYDCLHHSWGGLDEFSEDTEMFDFSLDSGLTVRTIEPLKAYNVAYEADGCKLNFDFRASTAPLQPGLSHEFGSGHYEQGGHLSGTLDIAGESLELDCWTMRDHSWGTRRPGKALPRMGFDWSMASGDHGFACTAVRTESLEDDPWFGTTERIISGWYLKDGVLGALTSGERRVVERGIDGRPLHVVLDSKDDHGREFHAEASSDNTLNWFAGYYSFMFQWWALAKWEYDGVSVWGEEQDFAPLEHHRRFVRSLPGGAPGNSKNRLR
jgi:hypothetical protein